MATAPRTGPARFGYRRENGRLVADPDEAPVVLRIFELFAEHQRRQTVAEILNQEGCRTRAGAIFTTQTVTRLLNEEAFTGTEDGVAAIVSRDLWERCNAILQAQQAAGGARRSVAHLFSGFVHCGGCGQKMYVPSKGRKYVCNDCRIKIAAEDLELIFRSQLKTYALSDAASPSNQTLHECWPTLSFKNKREIVEAVTKRIDVAGKKITCYLFSL